jgi:hypothetical protein
MESGKVFTEEIFRHNILVFLNRKINGEKERIETKLTDIE